VFQSLLHSRGPGVGLTNTGGISDPRLDDLTAKIAVELDAKKRQAMINDGIKIVQDNVYTIPLHQQTIVWAAKDNVQLTQPADNNFPMRWVTVK
jgi:peptide/nickel transport system substrate-binding protein